ncbi:MAG TPA: signal recognition particle-docking protein FtsY, partial [Deltaproteobacteria bacterium]|nr:signal recognition particle-docking protein FtsY [Deltaproteobacteria bacterium]
MGQNGFFKTLKAGLTRTRDALAKNLDSLLLGEKVLDNELFEELEELLISADLGPQFALELIDDVKEKIKRRELGDAAQIKKVLREHMCSLLSGAHGSFSIVPGEPFIIMVVGVNGSGKTTTIGKLAHLL